MYICNIFNKFICLMKNCFHLLAIVNSATMNMGLQILKILVSLFLDKYSEMGLLEQTVVLF